MRKRITIPFAMTMVGAGSSIVLSSQGPARAFRVRDLRVMAYGYAGGKPKYGLKVDWLDVGGVRYGLDVDASLMGPQEKVSDENLWRVGVHAHGAGMALMVTNTTAWALRVSAVLSVKPLKRKF